MSKGRHNIFRTRNHGELEVLHIGSLLFIRTMTKEERLNPRSTKITKEPGSEASLKQVSSAKHFAHHI